MGFFSILNKSDNAKQKLEITDNSGFIGVVNNDKYSGFVDEDWELEDVLKQFTNQTNEGNCVIWSTGEPNLMNVYVLDEASKSKPYRETQSIIRVTNEKLWLVNYTDLTMVAQFKDSKIPSTENSDLEIPIANGVYKLTLRQMFNPKDYNWEAPPKPCFEIVFNVFDGNVENEFKDVIWWKTDEK